MPTRREYLSEKRSNFHKWLSSLISQDLLKDLIETTDYDFCLYISRFVQPRKDDLDSLLLEQADNLKIDITSFRPEDRDKFKRYLLLFCDILS